MPHPEGPFCQDPFDHRQHLKFAWSLLREGTVKSATAIVTDEISTFAALHAPGRYHETLTQFWIRLLAHTRAHDNNATDFDAHLCRFPILLSKQAPSRHYSPAVLDSPTARRSYVPPDILAVPFN